MGEFGIPTIIHGVLALLLLIELGLTGYMVSATDTIWSQSPSRFSFMLFNSIFSILVLAYIALTVRFLERIYRPIIAFGLVALVSLFWFAGSIALAVWVGVGRCYGNGFCQTIQAAVAFGFFIWAGFSALAILAGPGALRGGARADRAHKPGQPAV